MLLTRKIGAFLRGRATRMQVFLAAVLAGLLGFVPGFFLPGNLGGGFGQAPGLILLLVFLVLILNANLGVFTLVLLVAKLASLPLLPVSFAIGRALIDGPLQPLFRVLANAPVFAWFGFEYYATTGGLVLGLLFGLGAGWLFVRSLSAFRHKMAGLEEGSERYQKLSQSRWLRFLAWLFFGAGKGKKVSWHDLAESHKRGLPVRIMGVVVVAISVVTLWLFLGLFATPILTSNLRTTMTAVNGATVDLEKAELRFGDGTMALHGLAVADSGNLGTDVFRADLLRAQLDTGALLRRRFVIDEIKARDAGSGVPRAVPGVRTDTEPEPPPPPEPGTKTIDDYLKDIEVWRERIQQAREWLQKLSGGGDAQQESPEQRERRIEEERARYGPAMVAAEHLRDEQPAIVIRKIDIEGIVCAWLGGEIADLRASSLSSAPALLAEPPSLSFATQNSEKLLVQLQGPARGAPSLGLAFKMTGVSVDDVFGGLKIAGAAPLRGGTFDVATTGTLNVPAGGVATIELPVQTTLHDTTLALAGATPTMVENLQLPLGLRGPLLRPAVMLDDRVLSQALLQAGKQELARFVDQHKGELLGVVPGADQLLEAAKNPETLLDSAAKQAEDAAKKAAEDAAKKAAEEAAKKGAGDLLRGIIPGKKN